MMPIRLACSINLLSASFSSPRHSFSSERSALKFSISEASFTNMETVGSAKIEIAKKAKRTTQRVVLLFSSGKRDSDPRPRPWQGRALPTELFPRGAPYIDIFLRFVKGCGVFFKFFLSIVCTSDPEGSCARHHSYDKTKRTTQRVVLLFSSGKRDSDPRPRPWQGRALPTELFPRGVPYLTIFF